MRPSLLAALFMLAGCGIPPEVIVGGMSSNNPAVREDMIRIADKVDDPKVVAALIRALNDDSDKIRIKAAEALGELGHKEAVPDLITLMEHPSEKVRRAAIEAIGLIADPVAVEPLIQIIETSDPNDVPLNAIWALGRIGDKQAVPALSKLRSETTNTFVYYNVNVALLEIG